MNENFMNLMDDLKQSDNPNINFFDNENVNVLELGSADEEVPAKVNEEIDPDILALSDREKLFCVNYVHNGMNIYQAAVSAGYSESYAKSSSYKLRENVGIKKYISHLMKEIEQKMMNEAIASKEELLIFLTNTMRGKLHNPHAIPEKAMEVSEQLSFLEMDKDGRKEFSVPDERKIPLSLRIRACEDIVKCLGLFDDVLQKNVFTQNVIVSKSDDLKDMSEDDLKRLAQRLAGGMNG